MRKSECGSRNVEVGMQNVECGSWNGEGGIRNAEVGKRNWEQIESRNSDFRPLQSVFCDLIFDIVQVALKVSLDFSRPSIGPTI